MSLVMEAEVEMTLELLTWPDPRLRVLCDPVQQATLGLEQQAADMFEIMRAHNGIGLAAPQVGLPIRMFVMHVPDDEPRVFVNPVIHKVTAVAMPVPEGCLSFPHIQRKIRRLSQIGVTYRDLYWESRSVIFSGLKAQCIQHEVDHLNRVLFIDKGDPLGLADSKALDAKRP